MTMIATSLRHNTGCSLPCYLLLVLMSQHNSYTFLWWLFRCLIGLCLSIRDKELVGFLFIFTGRWSIFRRNLGLLRCIFRDFIFVRCFLHILHSNFLDRKFSLQFTVVLMLSLLYKSSLESEYYTSKPVLVSLLRLLWVILIQTWYSLSILFQEDRDR